MAQNAVVLFDAGGEFKEQFEKFDFDTKRGFAA